MTSKYNNIFFLGFNTYLAKENFDPIFEIIINDDIKLIQFLRKESW